MYCLQSFIYYNINSENFPAEMRQKMKRFKTVGVQLVKAKILDSELLECYNNDIDVKLSKECEH